MQKKAVYILLKILTLSVLVFIINLVIGFFVYQKFTPFYWGSRVTADKYEILHNSPKVNTIFMGSSKIFRQVIPHYFDSTANAEKYQSICSFNYGIDAMLPPESYTLYANLLENGDLKNIKYAFLELSQLDNPKPRNFHKHRLIYWIDFKNYVETIQINWSSVKPTYIKLASVLTYSMAYLENLINFGIIQELSNFYTKVPQMNTPNMAIKYWEKQRGVVLLDVRKSDGKKMSAIKKNLSEFRELSIKGFSQMEQNPFELKNYKLMKKVKDLISQSKQKGVHLIFLLTPRSKSYHYEELLPIFNQIPANHKLEVADARKYPQIYDPFYAFDADHVNKIGAKLFTQFIAEGFVKLMNEKNSN